MEKEQIYQQLLEEIEHCKACPLWEGRNRTVPGTGSLNARLMIIGEGPGAEEDKQGVPFVGAAGKLLDNMLDAVGILREEVYIANIVKCRPPQNRAPKDDESAACADFLSRQVELVDPEIILLMGSTAIQNYLSKDMRITKDRGKWMEKDGRKVLATFHPAALLRDPRKKPDSFFDMLLVKRGLERNFNTEI